MGISQKIIAVTIVSIGTSLPELITTLIAAKKGENSLAIGNLIGSNIFNTCIVIGLPVLVLGDAVTVAYGLVDVIFMLVAAVLIFVFALSGRVIRRWEGGAFLAIYALYGVYIFMQM